MEIVLNFDKKEMVVKEAAKVKELLKRLEKMLGKDLDNWDIVSDVVYRNNDWWYHRPYPTYPWYDWEVTSGTYCVSDKVGTTTDALISQ